MRVDLLVNLYMVGRDYKSIEVNVSAPDNLCDNNHDDWLQSNACIEQVYEEMYELDCGDYEIDTIAFI